jgi:uncharacterized protein DUF4342
MPDDAIPAGSARHEEVPGSNLIERIKQVVGDGNARAVRVRTDDGKIFLEIPLTATAVTGGVVVLAAPWLAILAALAALVARVKVEIVPASDDDRRPIPPNASPKSTDHRVSRS